jgi:hypothetical protein
VKLSPQDYKEKHKLVSQEGDETIRTTNNAKPRTKTLLGILSNK